MTAAALFDELLALVGDLNIEEQRATAKELSERKNWQYSTYSRNQSPSWVPRTKTSSSASQRSLLEKLKTEKLVLDWRFEGARQGRREGDNRLALRRATPPPPTTRAYSTRRSSEPTSGFLRNTPGDRTGTAQVAERPRHRALRAFFL